VQAIWATILAILGEIVARICEFMPDFAGARITPRRDRLRGQATPSSTG